MAYMLPLKSSGVRLSYWVQTDSLHIDGRYFPHGMVYFHIRHVHTSSMAEILAGTVDNRAGYGSVEAAHRVGVTAAAAVRAGITEAYDTAWGGPDLTLKWQQYNEISYCTTARIEFGGDGDYGAAEAGLEFLRWLGRKAHKPAFADGRDARYAMRAALHSPTAVATALDRAGAVRLMRHAARRDLIGDGGCFWIADTQPRVRFATDNTNEEEAA